jgi:hypothetical protein
MAIRKVVLIGDAAQDIYHQPLPPREYEGEERGCLQNWQIKPRWCQYTEAGGMKLLGKMLQELGMEVDEVESPGPEIQSLATLKQYKVSSDEGQLNVWRVAQFDGYQQVNENANTSVAARSPDNGATNDTHALVVDDAGNGARNLPNTWDAYFQSGSLPALLIHKMNMPLAKGALWGHVRAIDNVCRIVVVNADDLRKEGVDLSKRLSWNRTVADLCRAANKQVSPFRELCKAEYVIVRFDCDGACVIPKEGNPSLVFDPSAAEEDFDTAQPGTMPGKMSSFVAELVVHLPELGGMERSRIDVGIVIEAVKAALCRSRSVASSKFEVSHDNDTQKREAVFKYPRLEPVAWPEHDQFRSFECETVTPPDAANSLGAPQTRAEALERARCYVLLGENSITAVPRARFGRLLSVSQKEIENYRYLADLLKRYQKSRPTKPISIGVFGPPGAGKSFGVEEVVAQVQGTGIKHFAFNVSQFNDPSDLAGAFQEVRDASLKGRPPLVFFDEFDTDKYRYVAGFLAPMQDGMFRDGPRFHPIGPAIFVFAGATFHSYKDLGAATETDEGRLAKLPDFASRLSGYIDVLGPNPLGCEAKTGEHLLRRAILLRNFLWQGYSGLFSSEGRLSIDMTVLDALLNVESFRFGARSLQTILRMSQIDETSRHFSVADLPHADQLRLHVDAEGVEQLLREN